MMIKYWIGLWNYLVSAKYRSAVPIYRKLFGDFPVDNYNWWRYADKISLPDMVYESLDRHGWQWDDAQASWIYSEPSAHYDFWHTHIIDIHQ